MTLWIPLTLLLALPLWADSRLLTLREAARMALERHPSVEGAAARIKAADSRIEQAKGGFLPKVNYTESYLRGNNPVYVFGSLLTQGQFSEKNFAIDTLNHPPALNNFQSLLTVDQVLYDAGQIRRQTRSAELGRSIAAEDERHVRMTLIATVVKTYYGVMLAQESLHVAQEAVKSAEADMARAEAVRAAGMSTDVDVLSIRVHLAAMKEQVIRRSYGLNVARDALNEALGQPLDTLNELSTPLIRLTAEPAIADEASASRERPEARQARIASQLAETQAGLARSSFLPQVGFRGALEADRQRFVNRGGGNWMISASLRWNLFNGGIDRARVEEASHAMASARAQQRQTEAGIQLQVRSANAERNAAGERIAVADAAVAMAEESLRITKNRYEAGLATVTDLLRTETALLESRSRRLASIYDSRLAAASLELAAGTLSIDSEILK